MNVGNGHVGAEEEMKKIYGEGKVKPIPEESIHFIRNWGRKKRIRYAELLDLGLDTIQAYNIVENHKGIMD